MKVTQLINSNGIAVKNQFVITTGLGRYFKSYDSLVAFTPNSSCEIVLTNAWSYSATTIKHLKTFLGTSLSKKEIQRRVDSQYIKIDNQLEIK